ncbi:hypothetical protein [Sphaerobacter sp.]|uniref:hypothetical protein n=1 Tax=Sphaerobacter sp. TaxID=2099654 RepID=UPI001D9ECCDF|nr:hypothetical protein [Sphaerobacter sp.]MBX5445620.1 hypothetical protein [Sphaerobacter sp.]
MRQLTSEPELRAAREAFHRVFRSGDAFTAPFQAGVQGRAILYPVVYFLQPEDYEPIAAAAQSLGETLAYASTVEMYRGDGWNKYHHWEVELDSYVYDLLDEDEDWISMVGQALYSVKGTWGC